MDRDRFDDLRGKGNHGALLLLDYMFVHEGQHKFTVMKDRSGKRITGDVIDGMQEFLETYGDFIGL